ncbi:RNA polymerase II-associated protein [Wolfiporia cocos MD-104 SS10]|uniref:RNA polymerase II-associated protein n=1 Tax=Wolfiporia cocos (strain MD-104) TaxID=742152 RepID=A0A2H3JJ34_WOLCO|nr:RNA polymerase II-associated protein [Wolfiporia cocos MD-104 SS10]
MNGLRSPSPAPAASRSIDIELGQHEVINIELDNLDPDPQDLLELLKDGQCKVWIWTRLAAEYWRRGYLDAAERIAQTAVESMQLVGASSSLQPIYALLANIQIARAATAPKLILQDAREDIMTSEKARDEYYKEAAQYFNQGERASTESGEVGTMLAILTRAVLQVGQRTMDDALRSFDGVLVEKPTNLVALLGKAKIMYARRQFHQALKLFQTVLKLKPDCLPDPRIGIGLCLWAMDHKEKAKAAWQRSVEVNPSEWSAQLLLGLEAINASRNENQSQEERKSKFLTGTRYVEKAFRANQRNSAAANALCELFLQKGQYKKALKLAERAIQFTDVKAILTDGCIRAGRVSHALGATPEALRHYTKAKDGQPTNLLATIGIAQMQLKLDETAAAVHTLDSYLQQTRGQRPVEAVVMLASLRAHPRPGVSSADQAQEKVRARELFDQACKTLGLHDDGHSRNASHVTGRSARKIAEDMDMHAEIARLWQGENVERMERALKEALRINETTGRVDPRLTNNIGVLRYLEGNLDTARTLCENAITHAANADPEIAEGLSTTILYNLARTYEEQGEEDMAKQAYEKLLHRHPEYIDAKIRQAQMLIDVNRRDDAHDMLKQALSSQGNNLNLRAYYTYFLIQSNMSKFANPFLLSTLKDLDKHDLYSLCAAGWIQYHQARESRDISTTGITERRRGFQRSAEFYDKALQLDPMCAIAAQGLAIVTAEDALGTLGGTLGPPAPDEAQRRIKNARDALDIFAKVRESLNDGSVYVNMGHCYYARDEFDRAIESYETASKRFYGGHNVPTLLSLCRSWYAKANKDQSFSAMNSALQYAQKAFHLHPYDKAIMYNIAMIQQKAAEMLMSIPPAKRSLNDLQKAIEQATHAQKLFASLAADKSPLVPYNRDIADQRRKYGDSMLRRCDEHLATQRQWEAEVQAKLEAARQRRQQDKQQQEALERERAEELRKAAEELAEERRKAREQALEWTRDIKLESDEERERKATKKASRKIKTESGSGEEGEVKRKRRGKLRKTNSAADGDDGALFSGDEDGDKPVRKRTKKRAIRDDDEEEETAGNPRKKQIKSKEYISDSDEDMS